MRAFRFRVPFTKPIRMKGKIFSFREGVLLERGGNWAEASPLPGFSPESIDDVISALVDKQTAPPSLDFALSELDSPLSAPVTVSFNRLLLGAPQDVIETAKNCRPSNCKAVKLKVGQNALADDIAMVQSVRRFLPAEIRIRLDANQAWEFPQAMEFLDATTNIDFDYIEEPLRKPDRLEELFSRTGVKYALDESLIHLDSWKACPNATALICKPTILGGEKTIERLAKSGKPIVFSAAFESGVGVARIARLAARYSPGIPVGLDTLDWLEKTLLKDAVKKQDGLMTFPWPLKVDETELEEIEQ